ncbi:dihydrolipoamide acetyltransferase family protein [Mycolicibacterium goodii]|uniref:dihydrolipoamide acetyltransferase family protein n=1 Tax=Mycolicibacterium goodii TaxID=134601 RepID=UPI001BDD804D|nr:dihydrolipoamide acetyltransferase family protein [Mycolicibacterium goodii]MBU8817243.1 2-oxo acid dehydrogenase subunit E2 [Mycolicibacterium goodii]MBU8828412.1 2-oxo acid dehydrogenase subunit E2 [Mycolicibacterium goodii]
MATISRFKLPDVGEGLTEAEITTWFVAVGDIVEVNQTLCEIETAKSAVELPSPVAGIVEAIHVEVGDTVEVGTPIISFRTGADVTSRTASNPASTPSVAPETPAPAPDAADEVEPDVSADAEPAAKILVGTGPSKMAERRRHLRPRSELPTAVPPGAAVSAAAVRSELRVPVKGVRKAVATAMVNSAFTAPHVTEWLSVDITETMNLVRSLKTHPRWEGLRVNPLLFVAQALVLAATRHPAINASWDDPAQEIVYHGHVNLGIAAATPRGLVVPNIKHADLLTLPELASAISDLVHTAREGRTGAADMANGTITLTNIGALGVDAGTPILNPGEAAILAFGAVRPTPWVHDGEIRIREVTQLALSFDHRLVDGELGSAVLTELAAILSDPARELLHR